MIRRARASVGMTLDDVATRYRRPLLGRNDRAAFFRAWLDAPLRTGAQMPSTHRLAAAMAREAGARPGLKVVELGPGTGVVTQHLIAAGVAESDLVLIESNPAFCHLLRARYRKATIIDGDAFDNVSSLARAQPGAFASIVSSLPLFVYPREKRIALLDHAFGLLGPEGRVIQFTYGIASPFPLRRDCIAQTSRRIWRNLWPAVVWSYSLEGPQPRPGL